MKIKKIHLKRFRQFKDATIEVDDFNLLVGPNNSGKTSLLYAVRSFFLLMSGHVVFEGSPPKARYHRRFLPSAEEIAPVPDIQELWYKQQSGGPLSISITFEDDIAFSVVLRMQFRQLHVSTDKLPRGLTSRKASKYLDMPVAFIPGLVGVLVNEPYANIARRNALATQGRYAEIFRSSLHQLSTRVPDAIEKINKWLEDLFGVRVTRIDFNPDLDEFVTVKYQQGSEEYDVVSSGAGLQQVIQMLTYLYLSQPKILLIDEPDAHLHSSLQARLGELFRRVAADLNAQVFLSTHSLDLMETFSNKEIILVDPEKETLSPIGEHVDLISTLVDADIIDFSSLSRVLASRKLVVVEDKDKSILRAIDRAIGSKLFSSRSSSYVLSAKGVGNFRALADLGHVLQQLVRKHFDLTFVQDRDGLPDFIVDPFIKSQNTQGVNAVLLERHEIENYLLEPGLIMKAAITDKYTIGAADIENAILEAAKTLRPKAIRLSLNSAKDINRHLKDGDRYNDAVLEEKVYAWFDGLDINSLDVVRTIFPGKELLDETLKVLESKNNIKLTKGKIVAAIESGLMAKEIIDLIDKAAS